MRQGNHTSSVFTLGFLLGFVQPALPACFHKSATPPPLEQDETLENGGPIGFHYRDVGGGTYRFSVTSAPAGVTEVGIKIKTEGAEEVDLGTFPVGTGGDVAHTFPVGTKARGTVTAEYKDKDGETRKPKKDFDWTQP